MVTQVYGSLNGIQVCDVACSAGNAHQDTSQPRAYARSTVEVVQCRERVDSVGTACRVRSTTAHCTKLLLSTCSRLSELRR